MIYLLVILYADQKKFPDHPLCVTMMLAHLFPHCMSTYNALTPEEERIIVHKGTEAPFSGEYDDFFQQGTYVCRRCDTPLYRSQDKFRSGCGWPSFDDAIGENVHQSLDADGRRMEITCTHCGAHLGHVFVGEKLTEKDTRHCVNSLSMTFVPEVVEESVLERATLGGGCFWCLEGTLRMLKGVRDVLSGYSGGTTENPTYEEVSRDRTGHIEVVQVVFDPRVLRYETLLEVFFTLHDPTTPARQGNDVGEQYSSVIFYHDEAQKKVAESVISSLTKKNIWEDTIVTDLRPLQTFWEAEELHQQYYIKHPNQPYCRVIITPKVAKLRQQWLDILKE